MTRDEILNMKPGRELDALVAEKVMGWKNIILNDSIGMICMGTPPYMQNWEEPERIYIPNYSTDISAAWEVVEKMRERNFLMQIITEKNYFESVVYKPNGSCLMCFKWMQAETAPEAICKAALLAVMSNA